MTARYQTALLRLQTGTATRGDMATVRDHEAANRKVLKHGGDGGKVAETKPKTKNGTKT